MTIEYCDTCGTELTEDELGQGRCDACIEDQLDADVPGVIGLRRAARARIRRQLEEMEALLTIAGYTICRGVKAGGQAGSEARKER